MPQMIDRAGRGRYGTHGMARGRHVDGLMEKLLRAIECSLAASQAARETIEEIFRGADAIVLEGDELELTRQDREFLRSLSIRPDST